MVEVYPFIAEKRRDGCKIGLLIIQVIFARIILESPPGYEEVGVRNDCMCSIWLCGVSKGYSKLGMEQPT